ncbi:MAG: YeiH family protein [Candidatus Eiseniibacteriota bacterium]
MFRGLLLVVPLTVLAYFLSRLPGLSVVGPLGVALLVAALWRAFFGLPEGSAPGIRFCARPLLRFGIVLMGIRLDFRRLAEAGPRVLLVDVLVVALGAAFVVWLGRRLKVRRSLAILLGVGTSVCGASAIAATGPLVKADEDDVAVSIGLISVAGLIGVFAYPAIASLAGLADSAYGLLCGATLQEVPQVLAASFARGQATGDFGTLVKLARVALLAPLTLVLATLEARHGGERISLRQLPIPWFVIGFVALGAARSLGLVPEAFVPAIEQASRLTLAAAMTAVGLGVHADAIRRLGPAPVVLGILGYLFVIAIAVTSAAALGLL